MKDCELDLTSTQLTNANDERRTTNDERVIESPYWGRRFALVNYLRWCSGGGVKFNDLQVPKRAILTHVRTVSTGRLSVAVRRANQNTANTHVQLEGSPASTRKGHKERETYHWQTT